MALHVKPSPGICPAIFDCHALALCSRSDCVAVPLRQLLAGDRLSLRI